MSHFSSVSILCHGTTIAILCAENHEIKKGYKQEEAGAMCLDRMGFFIGVQLAFIHIMNPFPWCYTDQVMIGGEAAMTLQSNRAD